MKLNHTKLKRQSGFTIVELLIVIVVIGVLAGITIVAYSGITTRARTTKAQSNATSVQSVAEAMNADIGYYPRLTTDFTGAYSGSSVSRTTQLPAGITIFATGGTAISATNGESSISYEYCGATATPAAGAALGGRIRYWDFSTNAFSTTIIYVGSGAATIGTDTCDSWVTPES